MGLYLSSRLEAADLDLHYKFAAASKPATLLETTWGSYQTDLFSGSFGYGFPIKVPPGVNGLQPDLQLSYNSHSARGKSGWVGAGWDLPIPYIQRDINYTRKDPNDDSFDLYLGGKHDLVFVTADGRYRTSIDTFFKIEAFNSDNSPAGNSKNPAYWIVRMKDGTQYRFGHDADALKKIQTSDTSFTRYNWRWHLDHITDPNGNTISYHYDEVNSGTDIGAVYLDKITYNNDRLREIEFIRDTNPLAYLTINQGSEEKLGQRLKQIDIKVSGSLVRRYVLDYVNNDNELPTNLLLAKITEFGSDGTTALPATTFSYQGFTPGFNTPRPWSYSGNTPIRDVSSGNDTRKDVLDVNGDGLPDRGYYDNGWKIRLNNGNGFNASDSEWSWNNIGHPFRDINSIDNDDWNKSADTQKAPLDMDRDGYLDYVWLEIDKETRKQISQIYLGGDSSFNAAIVFSPPTTDMWIRDVREVTDNEPNVKAMIMDINGDGYPDYVQRVGRSGWNCWLGTGRGFGQYVFFPNPRSNHEAYLWDYQRDNGAHETEVGFYDMNGDGLDDIVDANDSGWQVYFNTGSNFIYGGSWAAGEKYTNDPQADGDERHDLFDINGDGLPDKVLGQQADFFKVRFNTGRGFTGEQQWPTGRTMPDNLIRDAKDGGSEVARDFIDLNGDGLVDMVFQNDKGDWDVYLNKAQKTDLMIGVRTSFGGTVTVTYRSSREFANTRLPFNYWLVGSVNTNNGMGRDHAVSATTSYTYEGGLYDFPTREFRGFAKVIEFMADGSKIAHHFHQDPGRKGKQSNQPTYASDWSMFASVDDTWEAPFVNGVYKVLQIARDENTWDGTNSAKTRRTEFAEHDNYGNARLVWHRGDKDISADDLFEYTEYGYNTSAWIVDKPSRKYFTATKGGAALRDTQYYYDGKTFGAAPDKGNLTKQIQDIDTGTDAITSFSYDSYGNRASTTDPEGRTSRIEYDPTYHTFPIRTYNAKNQLQQRSFAPATGNPLTETDANGHVVQYEYDVFHRLTKKALPYDSLALPTESRSYALNGLAPEHVLVSKRETSGTNATLDSFQVVDGFGSLIQAKTESASATDQIAVHYFYDKLGRLEKQSNPLSVPSSTGYSDASRSANGISYTYDTLGRPTRVTNPDGTFKSRIFDHWNVTETDENGHKKAYAFNARQQPLSVTEVNGTESFVTSYQYNLFGDLTQIRDHRGNTTLYGYDSLGRKISVNDPDLGEWTYAYDRAGNLVGQIDARNTIIQVNYDELNRKTREDYPHDRDVEYFYDNPTIGTVAKIVDNAGETVFQYDQRLRKVKETRKMDGFFWSTEWTHDAMNRVTREKRPNGEVVTSVYDAQGLLDQITGIVTNLDYNVNGQVTDRKYANNLSTAFSYHAQNLRLTTLQTGSLLKYSYQYDSGGNITKISNGLNGTSEQYTYDALDRLNSATGPGYTLAYAIDPIGNITQVTKNGKAENYYYCKNNVLPHAPTLITSNAPLVEHFEVNGGKSWTVSRTVSVATRVNGSPTEYLISENASFTGASWRPYKNLVTYQLATTAFGEKVLYYKVRNAQAESEVSFAKITYSADSNNDNIPDALDADKDGMLDSWELANGLNPNNANDASLDTDNDGLSNIQEFASGSNPNSIDTDGDTLSDGQEIAEGSSPVASDTDNDGLADNTDPIPSSSLQDALNESLNLTSRHFASGGNQRLMADGLLLDVLGNGLQPLYFNELFENSVNVTNTMQLLRMLSGYSISNDIKTNTDINNDGLLGLPEAIHGLDKSSGAE